MTLVLLAPVGLDHGFWAWTDLRALGAVAHDLPGFGGRPRGEATMAAFVKDVADRLGGLAGGPFDVVGCSLGAMVAQNLALSYPNRIRSLVLACTGASADPATMTRRAARAEAEGIEGLLGETLERWFTPQVLAKAGHPGLAYARSTLLGLDRGTFADAWRVVGQHDVTDRLGELRVPTTCIAASEDQASPIERVQALAAGIPGSRLVAVPGAHMAPLEDGPAFSRAVREHCQRVDRGKEAAAPCR